MNGGLRSVTLRADVSFWGCPTRIKATEMKKTEGNLIALQARCYYRKLVFQYSEDFQLNVENVLREQVRNLQERTND